MSYQGKEGEQGGWEIERKIERETERGKYGQKERMGEKEREIHLYECGLSFFRILCSRTEHAVSLLKICPSDLLKEPGSEWRNMVI